MKASYVSMCVAIIVSQILFTNAANYGRVKRQSMTEVTQIIDNITRLGNPSNLFQMLQQAFSSILKIFNPTAGRRKRSVDLERNLHDYLVKASKNGDGQVKIHEKADELENEFNWKFVRVPNLPEMPPIPGITEKHTSIPKDSGNLHVQEEV